MYDVVIVGGGISGMFAAIEACRRNKRVVILEKNSELGKKIYATGNGRCNFTNANMSPDKFETEDLNFVKNVLEGFDNSDLLEMVKNLGMPYYEKEGYYYPLSNSSMSFAKVLINEINILGVDVVCDYNVRSIEKKDDKFVVSNNVVRYEGRKCIISAGGSAMPSSGSSGDAYYYAKKLGHRVKEALPALCKLKSNVSKSLHGVKALANASLFVDDEYVMSDYGFVQFVNGYLSGIPIFQLSGKAIRAFEEGHKVDVVIDYFYKEDKEALINKIENNSALEYDILCGMLNEKIVIDYYKNNNSIFEGVKYSITGYGGFDVAQCTSGGVYTCEIDSKTLESNICSGLFFTGEIIDVAGLCGGYNIQFAASSGVLAGRNV